MSSIEASIDDMFSYPINKKLLLEGESEELSRLLLY